MSNDFCTFIVGSIKKKITTVKTYVKGAFNNTMKLQLQNINKHKSWGGEQEQGERNNNTFPKLFNLEADEGRCRQDSEMFGEGFSHLILVSQYGNRDLNDYKNRENSRVRWEYNSNTYKMFMTNKIFKDHNASEHEKEKVEIEKY